MKIFSLGCDHGGFDLKEAIKNFLKDNDISFLDQGCYNNNSVDYPDFANLVVADLNNQNARYGILICKSGIGMSISANREKKIRAALCFNTEQAKSSREHNNANIMVLGSNYVDIAQAQKMINIFMTTDFSGGKHERRVNKLS